MSHKTDLDGPGLKAAEAAYMDVATALPPPGVSLDQWAMNSVEAAIRAYLAALTGQAVAPVAWLHEITEPGAAEPISMLPMSMLSRSPNNPWSHWMAAHFDKCAYVVTPLYASPVQAPVAPVAVKALDERMIEAGMIPLSQLLAGDTPLAKWAAHTGVRDLATFEQWLLMRHREFMTMRASYELGDKDESDELYEWVLAHSGAFSEVVANFRSALAAVPAPPVEGLARQILDFFQTARDEGLYVGAGRDGRLPDNEESQYGPKTKALRAAALAALSAPPQIGGVPEGWRPTHRHLKRGSSYQQIGLASLQCSEPCAETAVLVIYRCDDGKLWARPHDEFNDGRFEAIAVEAAGGAI